MNVHATRRWRVGRKVGRNIYAVVGEEPSDDDVEIAVALGDEPTASEITAQIVDDHNRRLGRR